MKAVQWEEEGKMSVVTKSTPVIKPGHVLIRVAVSGLCGTDMHICHGGMPNAAHQVVIGHEFSGYVEQIHESVKTSLNVGDLVAIDPHNPCNGCRFCRTNKHHLCYSLTSIGITTDGGIAQYVSVPVRSAIPIPSGVPPDVASLTEPLSCVIHAIDLGEVKTGNHVLVIGAGPIGLMTCAMSVYSGAHVTVIEPNEMRRTNALDSFGASAAFAPREYKMGDPLKGDGFDVVFECVGHERTMSDSLAFAKAGATVLWVGVARPDTEVNVKPFDVYRRELTIRSTFLSPHCMERAANVLADGKVDWRKLISHKFSLEQFDDAWKVFTSGQGMKVCITPND